MYVGSRRGMGDSSAVSFPFVLPCTVGDIDPATGDTIAGCPSYTPAPSPPTPVVPGSSTTVTAQGYSTWLYVAAAGIGAVLLLKAFQGR